MAAVQGFTEMAHQVGGHATAKTSLKAYNGRILKPFQSKQRGEREREFYERVFATEKDSLEFAALSKFLPKYYGTVIVPEPEDGQETNGVHPGQYLILEDLTWGRKWPCIMDVKMGTRSYEDNATSEKIAYEKSKFLLQETVGFRIQGIKVFNPKKKGYDEFDKHFGRGISSVGQLAPAFRSYFPAEDAKTIKLLEAFLRRLGQLKAWFDEQRGTEFIASSFLFLYDGEESPNDDKTAAEDFGAEIRLIDFAHVTKPTSPKHDEGLRTGIATLISCFQTLLNQAQT
ncbi:inositol polyphosphate multikinase, putative [Phytophthora infestans T30-4]|uniref:Kinase n=1 Tax=Phytophthora infestans (strain T30-4) TaxID=403677 RepID=D0N240_PHYIT|nr:inositol polyphosphate multikinase, putative [Phytophthora infestans T30-4]EEY68369.1 inositol polyphosphate multikinase, putative [Phytophthora infestans T30-4]|eukprot:XP_002905528.1 inositol polyphosphate multikinase, putative [Phytophthora infestans T30-4]